MMIPRSSASARQVRTSEIVALLSPTLGQEKACDAVEKALHRMGISDDPIDAEAAGRALSLLAGAPGILGVAARFATMRAPFLRPPEPRPAGSPRGEAGQGAPDLVDLLACSLGREKSVEVVAAARRKLGLSSRTEEGAMALVLDELAGAPGPIGVAARLVQVRLHLA